MKFNIKQLKPKHLLLTGLVSAVVLLIVWHIYSASLVSKMKVTKTFSPQPVAEMPKPLSASPLPDSSKQPAVHTEQIKQNLDVVPLDMSARAGLQYVGRHPPFDINSVEDSEEVIQEHPARVDYGSPHPFQFVPHPEWAVSGTGYASPSNEHANEMFARVS